MKRERKFCGLLFAWVHLETKVNMIIYDLTYVPINITVFWDVIPWSLVDNCHSINPTYSYSSYHQRHTV